jgi:hypothetical protein
MRRAAAPIGDLPWSARGQLPAPSTVGSEWVELTNGTAAVRTGCLFAWLTAI